MSGTVNRTKRTILRGNRQYLLAVWHLSLLHARGGNNKTMRIRNLSDIGVVCFCCHECGVGEGRVVGGRGCCFPRREVGDGVGGEDGLYLALPDGEGGVAEVAEGGEVAGVALFVGGEFCLPEFAAR